MNKTALVTGATSGIGRATAIELAKKGYQIIATGRREDRLEELKDLITEVPVYTMAFDVRDKVAIEEAFDSLPEAWQQIEVLVNNAGNAHGLSPIQTGDVDDWDAMIDINVKGLLYVSRATLPYMLKHKKGHIINIGSIAGKEVYANGNVYCASKFAVDALSKAMRLDLVQEGIKVSEVNPGLVETEFSEVRFKGDKDRAATVYQGYQALQAEDIAELISFIVTRPAHVNLAEVLILPTAQASATTVVKE
ncbi:SDR family NAD(P)-dependent oxidoreductase [Pontibacter cellulosilyticus]|uniref:SDR family NAD(P)-dependent oxidoreductase n=1 Tax=Pontibacter cellulosilyticus TaxID=1720253 RepID=A0A923SIW1_9BACT|nr:SDR family NAD(P)-dependent oxidoreductase [Pontibacter cellulosilyticus]MBC5993249.1 SDR family NAD(P)-dependent oxidoreductase [Pontibacter cellulosilyticus]